MKLGKQIEVIIDNPPVVYEVWVGRSWRRRSGREVKYDWDEVESNGRKEDNGREEFEFFEFEFFMGEKLSTTDNGREEVEDDEYEVDHNGREEVKYDWHEVE